MRPAHRYPSERLRNEKPIPRIRRPSPLRQQIQDANRHLHHLRQLDRPDLGFVAWPPRPVSGKDGDEPGLDRPLQSQQASSRPRANSSPAPHRIQIARSSADQLPIEALAHQNRSSELSFEIQQRTAVRIDARNSKFRGVRPVGRNAPRLQDISKSKRRILIARISSATTGEANTLASS